jgi:ribosome-binding factor A
MLSVNDVRVTRDLAYADVYVSALGVDDPVAQKELIVVLEHAAGFLRSAVARENTMRTTPKLRFHYDNLIVEGARIETLIRRAVADDQDSQRRRGDGD